jgi:peptidoglycan/LPS O-acetylase OafA/YrhL
VRTLDRIFGWLMVALGFAQLALQFATTSHSDPERLMLGAGLCLAELLLGACNLMRAERPHDITLARVCVAGNVAWLALMLIYAFTLNGHLVPAVQGAVTLILLALSLRTRNRSRPM